jgi:hypothetical protein
LILLALLGGASRLGALPCDRLSQLKLDHVTIVAAESVAAGGFAMPGGTQNAPAEFFTAFDKLRPFCRVQAVARPTSDSEIGIEVWLPASDWNGRYVGVGNGGYGGSFNYYRLGETLNVGYVASSTDTGHRGNSRDTSWAIGHREKQIDFDYRAVHETAQTAKALIRAFYERPPRRSYFSSCSTGGRQGLTEAERYPADYDGIFAGAPAVGEAFTTRVTGDLDAFARRGGKIVIYHGGNDRPEPSIAFVDEVSRRIGEAPVRSFMQLYVVPGMGHCGSGEEPDDIGQWLRPNADRQHSLFKALERWVEDGVPPSGVIATRFVRDGDATSGIAKTRVLCPYRRGSVTARSCEP